MWSVVVDGFGTNRNPTVATAANAQDWNAAWRYEVVPASRSSPLTSLESPEVGPEEHGYVGDVLGELRWKKSNEKKKCF